MGEFAGGKAAHIDHHFDLISPQEMDKLFPRPVAGAQSKYFFFNWDYFVQRERPCFELLSTLCCFRVAGFWSRLLLPAYRFSIMSCFPEQGNI
jgi:hypothetical protein